MEYCPAMHRMTYFASAWQEQRFSRGLQKDGIPVARICRSILDIFLCLPPCELFVFLTAVGRLVELKFLTMEMVVFHSFSKSERLSLVSSILRDVRFRFTNPRNTG